MIRNLPEIQGITRVFLMNIILSNHEIITVVYSTIDYFSDYTTQLFLLSKFKDRT